MGIKPNQNGSRTYEILLEWETDLTSTVSSIAHDADFDVSFECINWGATDFHGHVGVALLDSNNHILEIIGMGDDEVSLPTLFDNAGLVTFNCKIPTSVPVGDYKIRAVVKPDSSDWMTIHGTPGYMDELPLTVVASAPTGIDPLATSFVRAFVQSQTLYIDSPSAETITVYSISGAKLYSGVKNQGMTKLNISLPQDVFIVKGSTGWIVKLHD